MVENNPLTYNIYDINKGRYFNKSMRINTQLNNKLKNIVIKLNKLLKLKNNYKGDYFLNKLNILCPEILYKKRLTPADTINFLVRYRYSLELPKVNPENYNTTNKNFVNFLRETIDWFEFDNFISYLNDSIMKEDLTNYKKLKKNLSNNIKDPVAYAKTLNWKDKKRYLETIVFLSKNSIKTHTNLLKNAEAELKNMNKRD